MLVQVANDVCSKYQFEGNIDIPFMRTVDFVTEIRLRVLVHEIEHISPRNPYRILEKKTSHSNCPLSCSTYLLVWKVEFLFLRMRHRFLRKSLFSFMYWVTLRTDFGFQICTCGREVREAKTKSVYIYIFLMS
jgi:hypothetical protein